MWVLTYVQDHVSRINLNFKYGKNMKDNYLSIFISLKTYLSYAFNIKND